MHEPCTTQYPVLYILLQSKDHGYAQGYRDLVDQLDSPRTDDRHFFRDAVDKHGRVVKGAEQRAQEFMAVHGLRAITFEEMANCRKALHIP